MALDKVEERHELINDLIAEAYDFKDFAEDFEDDNDWAGAKVILDYLVAAERLICAEEIFLEAFDTLGDVPHPNRDEQEHWLTIFLLDGVHVFVHEVLLNDLEYILKTAETWGFKTEFGEEFKELMCKNLETLIKKYQTLYDL